MKTVIYDREIAIIEEEIRNLKNDLKLYKNSLSPKRVKQINDCIKSDEKAINNLKRLRNVK